LVGGVTEPQTCPLCGFQIWSVSDAPRDSRSWQKYDVPGRYFRHMNENHPDYWKWTRRLNREYLLVIFVPALAIITLAFMLYQYQIVSLDTARGVGFLAVPAVFLGVILVWIFVEFRGTKRFREAWKQEHPI